MIKKAVLGTLLIGLIGILVAGAVIRTVDKTGNIAEAQGLARGRAYGQDVVAAGEQVSQGRGGGSQPSAV